MFKIIQQSTTGVKTTFGKHTNNYGPGLVFYIPFVNNIYVVSNKISQTNCCFNIKTKNDVFAKINVTIEYVIKKEDSDKALFSMNKPIEQITNNVENILISSTSNMDLNTLFESRGKLCTDVAEKMSDMEKNGFTIVKTLVTSINVDESVQTTLNKVYESKKILEAAANEADACKLKMVKQAEAEKESKILQGEGTAGQRNAILEGFSYNLKNYKEQFGMESEQILNFVLNVQRNDMLKDVGSRSNSNVIFLNAETQNSEIIKGLYAKSDPELNISKLRDHLYDN